MWKIPTGTQNRADRYHREIDEMIQKIKYEYDMEEIRELDLQNETKTITETENQEGPF